MIEEAVSVLVIETFRLNGRLLAEGDELVADLGLTSARWQVLGAIEFSPVPLPAAQLARNMGLSRQAVQRLTNELVADGLVRLTSNPHHRRAKLVEMTSRGREAYSAAMARQRTWARSFAEGFSVEEIEAAAAVLRSLRARLVEDRNDPADQEIAKSA